MWGAIKIALCRKLVLWRRLRSKTRAPSSTVVRFVSTTGNRASLLRYNTTISNECIELKIADDEIAQAHLRAISAVAALAYCEQECAHEPAAATVAHFAASKNAQPEASADVFQKPC